MRTRRAGWLTVVAVLAACGGDDSSSTDATAGGSGSSGAAGPGGAGSGGATSGAAGAAAGGKGGAAGAGAAGGGSGAGSGGPLQAGGAAGASASGASGVAGAQAGGAAGSTGGAGGKGGAGGTAAGAGGSAAGAGGSAAGAAGQGAGGAGAGSGGASGAAGAGCTAPTQGALAVVATYESMGLTLTGVAKAGATNAASVQFRVSGASAWKDGLPLVYDAKRGEYRGSIVSLVPGTTYEVRVTMGATCETVASTDATWSDTFPIGKTIKVPAKSSTPIEITDSGSATGYVLVEPAGASAVIDVDHKADYGVHVKGSYVIVRGLTVKNTNLHGIVLGDDDKTAVHDVIVEKNDVSGWGTRDTYTKDGKVITVPFGGNLHSALYSKNKGLERITVQRNVFHDPATTSNSWKEYNDAAGTYHPSGPQGISFRDAQGNHVIRYNEIYGNPEHHFNDAMGELNNFSEAGFPNRDTDIYGNYIAYTWDDGLELEGADRNVRVWGNYIDHTYIKIALAPVSVGPIYVWRNVGEVSQTGPTQNYGQGFFKNRNYGGSDTNFGSGAKFIFNNTSLTPTSGEPGSQGFLSEFVDDTADQLDNLLRFTVRNNIAHVGKGNTSFKDVNGDPAQPSDFDFDMYDGAASFAASTLNKEAHGLAATTPKYVAGYGYDLATHTGVFSLAAGSAGIDAGAVIPNFVETFSGAAPDIGAHEAGTPPMQFGINAYLP